MTIGVQFFSDTIMVNGDTKTIIFWDFGGVSRFLPLLSPLCRGADAGLIGLDLTSLLTLESIGEWTRIFRSHNPELPILLLGMKSDLTKDIVVLKENIQVLVEDYNLNDYFEVSSKTGRNFKNVFTTLYQFIFGKTSIEMNEERFLPDEEDKKREDRDDQRRGFWTRDT